MGIGCSDVSRFRVAADADVYADVDALIQAKRDGMGVTAFNTLQLESGINYDPDGLLFDAGLRDMYRPATHFIRDWMHTIAGDGFGNTHIAMVLHRLAVKCSVTPDQVGAFAGLCHYPSRWGKLCPHAFSPKRLREHTMVSFASTILTMVIVLHMFLEVYVPDAMASELDAFTKLHHIIGLLRTGPESAMKHTQTLTALISQHLAAFILLYGVGELKPKAHQLFHVVSGMIAVGRLLSCFVTDRKHRDVKRSALHVFRHIEHTVLVDLVNKSFQQVIEGHDLYSGFFLVNPKDVRVAGLAFRKSKSAVLLIGETCAGDLVIDEHGVAGLVIAFWQTVGQNEIYAEIDAYECINDDARFRSTARVQRLFIASNSIIDALIWYTVSPTIIRLSLPPALLYA